MIEKWKTVSKRVTEIYSIFGVSLVGRVHPNTNSVKEFVVIDSPEWVNIIPITEDNRVVMIRQFRHGLDDVTLEIPGGMVEANEDPCEAGMRECVEETGYSCTTKAELIGVTDPNPAFQYNKQYSYVWHNCSLRTLQNLDANEVIEVELVDISLIPDLIRNGTIKHSLVLSAFMHYMLRYSL